MLGRREMLGVLGGAALVPIVGCGSDGDGGGPDAGLVGACAPVPEETGGPYPGDGTNGPNALALPGIERGDIRSSIAGVTGTAQGVLFTVTISLVGSASSCAPLSGKAVYIWHCDRDASYSMYTGAAASQNYLRGVQVTGAGGAVTFTTIFPACYAGRWPHIHFEVYDSLAAAMSGGTKLKTSQLALPKDACDMVYAVTGYHTSIANLAQITLATDSVFSDGATLETPTVSGTTNDGMKASVVVGL